MELNKYIDLCEEQCGFSRDAKNPDSKGWRDILEFLCEDPGCKSALIARFKKRIEEDAEEAEVCRDWTDHYAEMASQDGQDRWFELAKNIVKKGGA